MSSKQRLELLAHGRVQRVGFRSFVQYLAKTYNLTGWVCNLPDGTVRIQAQGEAENLALFVQRIENEDDGWIQVTKLERLLQTPLDTETGFGILYYAKKRS